MAENGGEFGFIHWIQQQSRAHPRVPLGIGDDTAAVSFPRQTDCLVTVDMLMEGVHFTFPEATPEQVGRKALAVNLSDIAAMGGAPVAAVVSVALPKGKGWEFGKRIAAGIQSLASEFSVALAGGDTNSWNGPLVISITVLGECIGHAPVQRNDAQVGDWIMVTGRLGGSLQGKHLDFTPRLKEAHALCSMLKVHSMIDISDGLAADLHHILDASGVGAVLDSLAIPISPAAMKSSTPERSALEHALSDGEDFELLFTVSPDEGVRLLANPPFETPLTRIGEIRREPGCALRNSLGQLEPLPPKGWTHKL